jgi:hypothetical protein
MTASANRNILLKDMSIAYYLNGRLEVRISKHAAAFRILEFQGEGERERERGREREREREGGERERGGRERERERGREREH